MSTNFQQLSHIFGIPEKVFRWSFILFFAVAFPIVFLGNTWKTFTSEWYFNLPFGILYSTIITHLTLFVSRRMRRNSSAWDSREVGRSLSRQILLQMFLAMVAATLMVCLLFMLHPQDSFWVELRKNISGSLLAVAVLLGIYEGNYWFQQVRISLTERERLERLNVQGQMDVLRNQVKPHFLFNSLNTLASIIPEDSNLAVAYVENLAKVYRYILEMSEKSLVPIDEEIACVRAYLFLLQIRFDENIRIEFEDQEWSPQLHIVPLSIQLLVENAVQHNIASKRKPLHIFVAKRGDCLVVRNNVQPKDQITSGTGTGLKNINERYTLLADKQVVIDKSDKYFQVEIPLIKVT